MNISDRLKSLGIRLPEPAVPVANYVPYKLIINHTPPEATLVTSGMIPIVEGKPLHTGKLGDGVTIEQGMACAEVIRVNGFIACVPGFIDHPRVLNGCSDLLVEVFGDRGQHTRTVAGMSSLPMDVPAEIDITFKVM